MDFFERPHHPKRGKLTKTLLIMKFTAILLLSAGLQLSAGVYSQSVTLSVTNVPVEKVFKEINRQTGYQFFVNDALLKKAGKVSIDTKNASVEEVLQQCLADLPVTFTVENNAIVVKEKEAKPKVELPVEVPPVPINGKVTDDKGNPLPYVNIVIKGTSTGTATDDNGNFSLEAKKGDILVLSMIGYERKEITVGDGPISITLSVLPSSLDEVQVIAYGKTTRRENTGSVSTIKTKDLEKQPVTNVVQMLQGQMPGVSISQSNGGAIGNGQQIIIRGINTLKSGSNPLIIIDGVIVNNEPGGLSTSTYDVTTTDGGSNLLSNGTTPLNWLNPNDIESIDVLKDADATSIYGSRGSNGVILITTKKGKTGDSKFSMNLFTGLNTPTYLTPLMNTQQYLKMRKDAFAMGNVYDGDDGTVHVLNPLEINEFTAPDLTRWSQTAYTDWAKFELGNPAQIYNVDGNLTGGTDKLNYYASAGYFKQYDMQFMKPYQERLTGKISLTSKSFGDKLTVNFLGNFGIENLKSTTTSTGRTTPVMKRNPPNYEVYNPDGSLNFPNAVPGTTTGYAVNYIPAESIRTFSKTYNALLSLDATYKIYKDLAVKALFSYNSQNNNLENIIPSGYFPVNGTNPVDMFILFPQATFTTGKFSTLNIEPQLTYDMDISGGKLSLLAGSTFLDRTREATLVKVQNPGSDALLYSWSNSHPPASASNNVTHYRFNSVFARVSYNWRDKYLVNFTFRRDGSSRFGTENRFADFGSAGAAWIFSSEQFVRDNISFLSFGKLRGSYGSTGSDNIGDYLWNSLAANTAGYWTIYSYAGVSGLGSANFPNRVIQWEKTNKMDISLDLGFFHDRILLSSTFYNTLSLNLLNTLPLSSQTGFTGYTGNFAGKVRNRGWEFELNTVNLDPEKAFQWRTRFNISFNKNTLVAYNDLATSSDATTLKIGRAVMRDGGLEMPMKFEGIDPSTGLPKFKDLNGDGIIDWSDQNVNEAWIGSSLPNGYGGMNNSLTYKGFSLDIFVQFSHQLMTNWLYSSSFPLGSMYNPCADLVDNYWKKPGDVSKYPRLFTNYEPAPQNNGTYNTLLKTYYLYDTSQGIVKGTFFRLKNVQLAYNLPAATLKRMKMNNMTIYVRGENLCFINTGGKLFKDPEINSVESVPLIRSITAGMKLTF